MEFIDFARLPQASLSDQVYGNLNFEISIMETQPALLKELFHHKIRHYCQTKIVGNGSRFVLNFSLKLGSEASVVFSPSPENSTPFPLNLPMGTGATTPGAMEISGTLQQLVATFQQHGPSEELLPLMQRAMVALKVKLCERSYRCGNNGELLRGKRGEDG